VDWDRLRFFYAVVESGSLTKAGHAMNLSQSAISRQISGLENSLGVRLFNRHARGLVLTGEGEVLYKTTCSVYAQLEDVASKILETSKGMQGHLKLATTVAFGSVWLAPRLPKFLDQYPDLHLQVNLTDGDVDFVMREADVAVRLGKGEVSQDLVYDKLFDFKLKIYGSQDYFDKFGKPEKLSDLDDHRLLVFGSSSAAPVDNVNLILRLGCKPGIVRQPYLVMNNAYGLLQCAKNGLGLVSLATFIARDHGDLIKVLPDEKMPAMEAYMIYPKQLKGSKRIHSLYEFLKAEMAKKVEFKAN
jgi:DNA-binding transcriptional LysR family regulator